MDKRDEWGISSEVHSKAMQETVEQFYKNLSLSNLSAKKQNENGHTVGWLKWKLLRDFQSMTYSQSGFELKHTSTSGQTATLWLSKIDDIPIQYHREVPDNAIVKEVTLKTEKTGEWYVTVGLEIEDVELPKKSEIDDMNPELEIVSALTSAYRIITMSTHRMVIVRV
ncbi:hypothetical protein [Haloquadratum walsbyi]|uniref:hypothetical protein n=1 Tax=Haloquadratum walsbyi TaxID=293091 RepID=UPI0026E96B94|nr:hypothetical protein [Haloquadratum walsbyi]